MMELFEVKQKIFFADTLQIDVLENSPVFTGKTSVLSLFLIRDSSTGIFLRILQNVLERLFYRTALDRSLKQKII